jgi:cell division protease FtsH
MSRFFKSAAFPILIVIVLAFFASKLIQSGNEAPRTTYSKFLQQIDASEIDSVVLRTKDNSAEVTLKGPDKKRYTTGWVQGEAGAALIQKLRVAEQDGKVNSFDVKPARSSVILSLLTYVFPILIFIGFWIFLMNQVQGGGSKVMSFGKSRAKRMSVDSPKITFRDVAGVDEAVEELHEIKEFLENPKKFQALGARIPKGVLLYGPPGTGKTLLARAVAGEAGVPLRCSWAWAPPACATSSSRPSRTAPASSSWTRSTRSAAIAAPASAAVTTSVSRRSTSSWWRWTASRPRTTSS